ncbi:MAG: SH3 domain-containing protein [Oscillospiraceae bacterium]|nr:SH3 domain-containing protein [Oscillospiraceae bacterium]
MNKKALALLLAVLTLLLCGCSKLAPPPAPSDTPATPAPTVEEPTTTAAIQVFSTIGGGAADGDAGEPTAAEPVDTEDGSEPEAEPAPAPEDLSASIADSPIRDLEMVRVLNYMPDLAVDLRYATENNYTHKVVYTFDEPYLRFGTVKKLMQAQAQFRTMGYELVLWDAFRPNEAQFVLFDAFPNGNYVANPYGGGHSSHTSGGTVDVTLMKDGELCEMPSDMDEYSALGDRNYGDVSAEAASNARLLEQIMTANGFTGYFGEWWHYTDNTGYNYADVENAVLPEHGTRVYESECNEYINIRRVANASAEAIGKVPDGERMTVLSYMSDFCLIEYNDVIGYVNAHFIKPVYD